MLEDVIYQAIDANLKCHYLDVTGDGQHFDAVVVSDDFINKSRLQRHRMIYAALGDKMRQEVHALSMKLYTILEFSENK
ncbi:MAG: BolA/IbaG family iron-sulfur metabolism protein [Burkholderiales bacterium]|nr:BolA/IbaG family iron-sulfur metabolism protein [Burkholderiales bacterium]